MCMLKDLRAVGHKVDEVDVEAPPHVHGLLGGGRQRHVEAVDVLTTAQT